MLETTGREGRTAKIQTGGGLENDPAYKNHRSTTKYGGEVAADTALR